MATATPDSFPGIVVADSSGVIDPSAPVSIWPVLRSAQCDFVISRQGLILNTGSPPGRPCNLTPFIAHSWRSRSRKQRGGREVLDSSVEPLHGISTVGSRGQRTNESESRGLANIHVMIHLFNSSTFNLPLKIPAFDRLVEGASQSRRRSQLKSPPGCPSCLTLSISHSQRSRDRRQRAQRGWREGAPFGTGEGGGPPSKAIELEKARSGPSGRWIDCRGGARLCGGEAAFWKAGSCHFGTLRCGEREL